MGTEEERVVVGGAWLRALGISTAVGRWCWTGAGDMPRTGAGDMPRTGAGGSAGGSDVPTTGAKLSSEHTLELGCSVASVGASEPTEAARASRADIDGAIASNARTGSATVGVPGRADAALTMVHAPLVQQADPARCSWPVYA